MTRVLIVDDKEENLYYLEALLKGHGYVVEAARHGAEALVLARKSPPELVVSDLLMPVMDGYTLLRHWKADARLKRIPFIVYTATYTEAEDERLALNLGADAFIVKPMEPEEFLARLQEVQINPIGATAVAPRAPVGDENAMLRVYSETLIRKLEEKTLQLEEANTVLKQDIEERKRADEKLRESEERFRATFEQAAVGIAHVDPSGKFLRVNDKLCETTGYTRDELLQRTFQELTAAEDRSASDDARRAMLARSQSIHAAEKRYLRKNGRVFWGHVVTSLLRDAQGEPKYFISVISDITERKVLQEQFLRAQRMESIGTLAGGIAHDLNNLLSPITMGVGLLRLQTQDEATLRIIDTMERSAQRGTQLVKQVLSFARGVEGARMAVHLGHVAREIKEFVQSTFPKNIYFTATVPKETWLIHGDPTQLTQVMLNLCVNARDAMPSGGTLQLKAQNVTLDEAHAAMLGSLPTGRYVLLEISDSGTGMSAEVKNQIFEPFFTTKEPGKGTGLGLSSVLTIVRSHGGAVNVESEPGRGSTFKVYLPSKPDTVGNEPREPALQPPRRGHGELILAVDDDPAVLTMARQTLETFGYRVVCAEDGAQAIALYAVNRGEVAVVLLDMMMPVMDGSTLAKALRRIAPNVPIIGTSGLQANEDAAAGGLGQFLLKPYSADRLLHEIERAIGRSVSTESR
jgi:two-component system, cell cycle sensor histidine kinase and response regulator CckA